MLIAKNLTHRYLSGGRPLEVLSGIDLEVAPGEFVAVIGPSGSGKTTLLGLLAGLDLPSAGTIELDGIDLASLSEDGRARLRAERVGFVFQSFQLLPTLTAQENVQLPLELLGAREPGRGDQARRLLQQVGLATRGHHYPAQLSGGEQQRVALARALANRPRFLFADEPTGNLDRANGAHVLDLLEKANRDTGATVVLVTHDPALTAPAHRVVRLEDGRVASEDRR